MSKMHLYPYFFSDKERILYQNGGLSASIFRYDSGIEAIRLSNSLGYIVVLPYFGQMIWEGAFYDLPIGMRTKYPQPKPVQEFFEVDGCYLMHCGPRRICDMDNKYGLVHGELPLAKYDSACILIGSDENGEYLAVSGSFEYNRHRGDQYCAEPVVKLHAHSSVLEVSMKITNTSGNPLDYMYLFHTNSPARRNGRFVQPLGWTNDDLELFVPASSDGLCRDSQDAFEAYQKDPASIRTLNGDCLYEPEFCIRLLNPKPDSKGMYRFMQIDENGYADYTGVPADGPLKHFCRWITRTLDHSACSLCQPSSCGTLGYEHEKALGHVPSIAPGESMTAMIYIGLLAPSAANEMEKKILSIKR